jgi:histidinol-phosphatase
VSSDLDLAFALADLATEIALPRFHARDFATTVKPDGSPVTDVDTDVERALRERIGECRPGHAVIGEEYGAAGASEWCWYLDPIDGTRNFVAGEPVWMTLIALAYQDEITVGVVSFPALGERWWASRGDGAFHDGRPVAVSSTERLSEAVAIDDWNETLARSVVDHPLSRIAARCARTQPHREHSFLAVAAGEADVALSTAGYAWDYAPLKIIVEEAGGRFTDFDGGPRIDTRRAVVTNGLIHEQVLAELGLGSSGS